MKKMHLFLAILVIISTILLSSCAEKIDISIVFPPANYRVPDQYTETGVPIPVSIYYKGPEPQKIAIIKNINTGESYSCTLISGQENICGGIQMTKVGSQSIQVFVAKNNNEIVTETVTFRWEPYQGLELLAYNFSGYIGDKSMPLGMIYLAGLSLLIVGGIVGTIVIVTTLNKGYVARQGDSTSMTLIHSDGHKIIFEDKNGAFVGPGELDQLRKRLEPKAFAEFIKAMYPSREARRIILSQPDRHLMLESGEE